jgi:dihydroorotate dehydrogenase
MMDNGASLVQLYTGMVYRGPFVAKTIAKALSPRQSFWM